MDTDDIITMIFSIAAISAAVIGCVFIAVRAIRKPKTDTAVGSVKVQILVPVLLGSLIAGAGVYLILGNFAFDNSSFCTTHIHNLPLVVAWFAGFVAAGAAVTTTLDWLLWQVLARWGMAKPPTPQPDRQTPQIEDAPAETGEPAPETEAVPVEAIEITTQAEAAPAQPSQAKPPRRGPKPLIVAGSAVVLAGVLFAVSAILAIPRTSVQGNTLTLKNVGFSVTMDKFACTSPSSDGDTWDVAISASIELPSRLFFDLSVQNGGLTLKPIAGITGPHVKYLNANITGTNFTFVVSHGLTPVSYQLSIGGGLATYTLATSTWTFTTNMSGYQPAPDLHVS